MDMTPLQRIEALPSINAENADKHGYGVVYSGDPGTGKTTCALSWPKPIRGVYADVNRLTLRNEIVKGQDIVMTVPGSWSNYEDLFVPAVENRLFDCKTIVVDTLDFLSRMMWETIQGSADRLTQAHWGIGLNKLIKTTERMLGATQYISGKPTYNVIFCYHIKDVTDDTGALNKVTPAIMGATKDVIASCFDTGFLCDVRQVGKPVKKEGRETTEFVKEFFVHTAPPTRFHKALCKAGSQFPVQCSGMYQDLIGYLEGRK